jgi:hypothetical protein
MALAYLGVAVTKLPASGVRMLTSRLSLPGFRGASFRRTLSANACAYRGPHKIWGAACELFLVSGGG